MDFRDLLLPETSEFSGNWSRFFHTLQEAGPEGMQELNPFLSENLPGCFYTTRSGEVEFLGGDLVARRVRCFAWCFKQIGFNRLSASARDWCEQLMRVQGEDNLSRNGREDILSAKSAARVTLAAKNSVRELAAC